MIVRHLGKISHATRGFPTLLRRKMRIYNPFYDLQDQDSAFSRTPGGYLQFRSSDLTTVHGHGEGDYIRLRDEYGNVWVGCATLEDDSSSFATVSGIRTAVQSRASPTLMGPPPGRKRQHLARFRRLSFCKVL